MTDEEELSARCFIICPIGDERAEVGTAEREVWENTVELYEEVILPACEAHGLTPIRADQIAETGEIPEQVFIRLRDDDVVIADLTGGNPNVMYELGLRHTTGKLTIQLGEHGKLPFDVAAIRTIMFTRSPGGLIKARKSLTESLSAGLSGVGGAITATRVWDTLERSVAVGVESETNSEEPGFLEKYVDLEEHMHHLPELMNSVGEVIRDMHAITSEAATKIDKASKSGAPASARLHLANRLAASLEPLSERLQEIAAKYELAVEKVNPGTRHLLAAESDAHDSEQLESLKASIQNALKGASGFVDATTKLLDQLQESGNATRTLRRVNGRTRSALQRIIDSTQIILAWKEFLE